MDQKFALLAQLAFYYGPILLAHHHWLSEMNNIIVNAKRIYFLLTMMDFHTRDARLGKLPRVARRAAQQQL